MKHSAAEWSRWGTKIPVHEQNIVAIDIKRPPGRRLVVLPEGGANRPLPGDVGGMTAKTRANLGELHCAVEGCGRFATTVAGDSRHHFRHPQRTEGERQGHEPESREHFAAKHAIAQWIAAAGGDHVTRLDVDQFVAKPDYGPRAKPDVYVELDTGAKIAVEYQRSAGKVKDVLHKSAAYQSLGITVWWMYGPGPSTCDVLSPPGSSTIRVALTNNQMQLAGLKTGFFWFDATAARIGTPLAIGALFITPRPDELWEQPKPTTVKKYRRTPFTAGWTKVVLDDCGLGECELNISDGSLITPGTRRIQRDVVLAQEEIGILRTAARAERKRAEEASREQRERQAAQERQVASASAQVVTVEVQGGGAVGPSSGPLTGADGRVVPGGASVSTLAASGRAVGIVESRLSRRSWTGRVRALFTRRGRPAPRVRARRWCARGG